MSNPDRTSVYTPTLKFHDFGAFQDIDKAIVYLKHHDEGISMEKYEQALKKKAISKLCDLSHDTIRLSALALCLCAIHENPEDDEDRLCCKNVTLVVSVEKFLEDASRALETLRDESDRRARDNPKGELNTVQYHAWREIIAADHREVWQKLNDGFNEIFIDRVGFTMKDIDKKSEKFNDLRNGLEALAANQRAARFRIKRPRNPLEPEEEPPESYKDSSKTKKKSTQGPSKGILRKDSQFD